MGLLFAALAALFAFQRVGASVAGRPAEPSRQDGLGAKGACLSRQNDEHNLGDFLRQMRVTHPAQGHRINQIDVARDQGGERFLGIAPGIFPD